MVQLCQNHWKTIDGNGGIKKTLTIPSPWKIDHRCGLVINDSNIAGEARSNLEVNHACTAFEKVGRGFVSKSSGCNVWASLDAQHVNRQFGKRGLRIRVDPPDSSIIQNLDLWTSVVLCDFDKRQLRMFQKVEYG